MCCSQSRTSTFLVQLSNIKLKFEEESMNQHLLCCSTRWEVQPHTHSNVQSVTAYLRSIPFCARYLSIVSVVLLTVPAVSNAIGISFSDRIHTHTFIGV